MGAEAPADRTLRSYCLPYTAEREDYFQAFYRAALATAAEELGIGFQTVSVARLPGLLSFLQRLRYSAKARWLLDRPVTGDLLDGFAGLVAGACRGPWGPYRPEAPPIELRTTDGTVRRFVVDATDAGALAAPELIDVVDAYFKANWWPSRDYPDKVHPIPFLSGNLIKRYEPVLALRDRPRQYDVSCVMRIWGGEDKLGGIEHALRMVEAVAAARCSKFVYAVLLCGNIPAMTRRLGRQGIACGPRLPFLQAMESAADARLSITRLGMHYAAGYRISELMAMGRCPVFDRQLCTQWPEPLLPGVHYLDLGLDVGPGRPVASDEAYREATTRLEAYARDHALSESVEQQAREYYDRCLVPSAVGHYLLDRWLSA